MSPPGLKLGVGEWLIGAKCDPRGEPFRCASSPSPGSGSCPPSGPASASPRPSRADRHASFPFDDYADLRTEGLLLARILADKPGRMVPMRETPRFGAGETSHAAASFTTCREQGLGQARRLVAQPRPAGRIAGTPLLERPPARLPPLLFVPCSELSATKNFLHCAKMNDCAPFGLDTHLPHQRTGVYLQPEPSMRRDYDNIQLLLNQEGIEVELVVRFGARAGTATRIGWRAAEPSLAKDLGAARRSNSDKVTNRACPATRSSPTSPTKSVLARSHSETHQARSPSDTPRARPSNLGKLALTPWRGLPRQAPLHGCTNLVITLDAADYVRKSE